MNAAPETILNDSTEPTIPFKASRRLFAFGEFDKAYRTGHVFVWCKTGSVKLVLQYVKGQPTIHEVVLADGGRLLVQPMQWLTLCELSPDAEIVIWTENDDVLDDVEFGRLTGRRPSLVREHDGKTFLEQRP